MPEIYFKDYKKYYAKAVAYPYTDLPITTGSHEHISGAVDEAIEKAKSILKTRGFVGKAELHIDVFVEEDNNIHLIQSVKTKIVVN